jgi:hypothetical protein
MIESQKTIRKGSLFKMSLVFPIFQTVKYNLVMKNSKLLFQMAKLKQLNLKSLVQKQRILSSSLVKRCPTRAHVNIIKKVTGG